MFKSKLTTEQRAAINAVRARLIDKGIMCNLSDIRMSLIVTAVNKMIMELFPASGKYWTISITGWYYKVDTADHCFTNGYHHQIHTLMALFLYYEYLEHLTYGHVGMLTLKQRWEAQTIVIALAWHDHAHSQGATDDDANIKRALAPFAEVYEGEEYPVVFSSGTRQWAGLVLDDIRDTVPTQFLGESGNEELMAVFLDTVARLIGSTRYPYESDVVEPDEGLMRDLDRLSMITPCWFDLVYIGLYNEIYSNAKQDPMDFKTFCMQQHQFTTTFKYYNHQYAYYLDGSGRTTVITHRSKHIADLMRVDGNLIN